jgi:ABC-type transport system involved in cytochrome c biogenesis permease subunit
MEIKFSVVGALIYLAMLLYLCSALVARSRRFRTTGRGLYALGFLAAAAALVLHGYEVEHVPLQNLFEVFLCLGMLVFPISVFCRRFLKVGGEAADAVIGFLVLFPAGFVFSEEPQRLPPVLQSFLFVPHVSAYMLSYVILAKAFVPAFARLVGREGPAEAGLVPHELAAYRMTHLGFPLLTLGLILGAWWGKLAWGDYWNWDPKELWSLVSWLVFLGYLHFRSRYGTRFARASAALVVVGFVAIVITLLWVNLGKMFAGGLHSYAA